MSAVFRWLLVLALIVGVYYVASRFNLYRWNRTVYIGSQR